MINIIQDDCDPNSFEHFENEVLKLIGTHFMEIKMNMIKTDDLGDLIVYRWGPFEIRNEIGIYSIKQTVEIKISEPDTLWTNMKTKMPGYGQRVMVFDEEFDEQSDPPHKCATFVELSENKLGKHYTWQVENEQESNHNFAWWCELPCNPPNK